MLYFPSSNKTLTYTNAIECFYYFDLSQKYYIFNFKEKKKDEEKKNEENKKDEKKESKKG